MIEKNYISLVKFFDIIKHNQIRQVKLVVANNIFCITKLPPKSNNSTTFKYTVTASYLTYIFLEREDF